MSRNRIHPEVQSRRARRPLVVQALLGAVVLAGSGPAQATSLEEAVRTALTSNPQVSEANALERAARSDVREARAGYYPSLDATARVGRERSNIKELRATNPDDVYLNRREFGLRLSQLIYDGEATSSEIDRRAALLDAAGGRAQDTREAVAFRTAEVYLEVLKSQKLLELARANVAAHEDTLGKVRRRVERGVSQLADLKQAEARLALAKSTLTAREGRLWETQVNYRRVVGEFPSSLMDPPVWDAPYAGEGVADPQAVKQAIDEATAAALDQSPALRAAQAEVEAASATVRNAQSAYKPQLSLEATMNRDENIAGVDGVRNTDSVMLVGRWNLYRGGADQAREKASAERQMAAMDAAADTRRLVEENVAVALQAKATTEARLLYLEGHVLASEETLESYRAQLELGRRSLLDVLNAENEVFTARSNYAIGRYDDLLNQYFVEASKGALVKSLGLAEAAE